MARLCDLAVGQRARIDAVEGADALTQRLREMGLLEGDEIAVVAFAPLGDPMEIRVNDYHLSLRKTEAQRVTVTPL
jgi:Fe2+ transport system protein FeoA